MSRRAAARSNACVVLQVMASCTPSPPATIKVVNALADPARRASISTPEELRTGPGLTAMTLIEAALPASRAAISNTEIGPAASSNWKSGKDQHADHGQNSADAMS